MKPKLSSYLTFENQFYSIELTQLNGETLYYGIQLRKKKNQVELEDCFTYSNIKDTSKYIPKNKATFLIINNQFVITKRIENSEADHLKLLNLAFPNIKVDDFYYEILQQEHIHFIAICRRSHLDAILNDFKSKNICIVDFSLGNLMIASLTGYISEHKIHTNNACIICDDGQITDIQLTSTSNSVYDCNTVKIENKDVLNFSGALSLVTKTKNTRSYFDNTQEDLVRNYKEKQFFIQFLKIGLVTLFCALLLNFFVFNNYHKKIDELRETTQVLNSSKSKVVHLNETVQKAQKTVEDILRANNSKSSYYTNVLIKDLPEQIRLSEFNYQPLLKKIKEKKPIENELNTILVSGSIYERTSFSDWIISLEQINWIASVEIIKFEDVSKSSSVFSIKINIKHDTKN
ncbi:hypothetical protein [uncultured Psychroserpens sp.]|uniref:hypothetical protein n=1 Tax=uncultured Psychroserpens sp. TaxID=255436 RepID=UPI00262ED41B|nr:hypothetical protein [uncultured Psychroserpens sp.]